MIEPVGNRVLIKRDDSTTKTNGGIVIPDAYTEKSDKGIVLAVGWGLQTGTGEFVKPDIKEGDRVLFQKMTGTDMTVDGADCVMIESYNILAVIEDE